MKAIGDFLICLTCCYMSVNCGECQNLRYSWITGIFTTIHISWSTRTRQRSPRPTYVSRSNFSFSTATFSFWSDDNLTYASVDWEGMTPTSPPTSLTQYHRYERLYTKLVNRAQENSTKMEQVHTDDLKTA
jgi:hypothetical protein